MVAPSFPYGNDGAGAVTHRGTAPVRLREASEVVSCLGLICPGLYLLVADGLAMQEVLIHSNIVYGTPRGPGVLVAGVS